MSNKIKNFICRGTNTIINEDSSLVICGGGFEKFSKSIKSNFKKRNYKTKKRGYIARSNKELYIITMEEFISNYLGIDGSALEQMKNITHDDLEKMNFNEVQRVPFEVADGYGTEYFIVIDSNGKKIPYRNPLEKIRLDNIKYENRHTKCLEANIFHPEYEDEFNIDEFEEDINERYNEGGRQYGKY